MGRPFGHDDAISSTLSSRAARLGAAASAHLSLDDMPVMEEENARASLLRFLQPDEEPSSPPPSSFSLSFFQTPDDDVNTNDDDCYYYYCDDDNEDDEEDDPEREDDENGHSGWWYTYIAAPYYRPGPDRGLRSSPSPSPCANNNNTFFLSPSSSTASLASCPSSVESTTSETIETSTLSESSSGDIRGPTMPSSTLAAPVDVHSGESYASQSWRPKSATTTSSRDAAAAAAAASPFFNRWARGLSKQQQQQQQQHHHHHHHARGTAGNASPGSGTRHSSSSSQPSTPAGNHSTSLVRSSSLAGESKRRSQTLTREEFEALPVAIQRKVRLGTLSLFCSVCSFCSVSLASPAFDWRERAERVKDEKAPAPPRSRVRVVIRLPIRALRGARCAPNSSPGRRARAHLHTTLAIGRLADRADPPRNGTAFRMKTRRGKRRVGGNETSRSQVQQQQQPHPGLSKCASTAPRHEAAVGHENCRCRHYQLRLCAPRRLPPHRSAIALVVPRRLYPLEQFSLPFLSAQPAEGLLVQVGLVAFNLVTHAQRR